MALIPDSHRAWAQIDLSALTRNIHSIRAYLPHYIRYIAVVKADAYGHGLEQVVPRMMQCKVDAFAVANVLEGARIREIGSGWPIIVLSPILKTEYSYILSHSLIPTISSIDEAFSLNKLAQEKQTPIEVHLKIDTGMGRCGVWHTEARAVYTAIKSSLFLKLKGIYTHLQSSQDTNSCLQKQRTLFLNLINSFQLQNPNELMIHTDNSIGLHSFLSNSIINTVRVGILQYGIVPNSLQASITVEPILSFHSKICLIKQLPRGTAIGYEGTFILKKDSTIGIICAGYADGVNRLLSNKGYVLIHNQKAPILGRISMDQTTIDLSSIKNTPKEGEIVTFIGHQGQETINAKDFAKLSKTIPYEVLCNLSKRTHRVYIKDTLLT